MFKSYIMAYSNFLPETHWYLSSSPHSPLILFTSGSLLNFFFPPAPSWPYPPLFLLLTSLSSCPCCFCSLAPSSISSIYNGASRGGKTHNLDQTILLSTSLPQFIYCHLKSSLVLYPHPSLQISQYLPPSHSLHQAVAHCLNLIENHLSNLFDFMTVFLWWWMPMIS